MILWRNDEITQAALASGALVHAQLTLLGQVVNFHYCDTGAVVLPQYNAGVVPRSKGTMKRALTWVRGLKAVWNLARFCILLPVVIGGNKATVPVV